MTSPGAQTEAAPPPQVGELPSWAAELFSKVRGFGIRRAPVENSTVVGICQGVAHRYGLPVWTVQVAVVLAGLFFGTGLLLYGLGWMLLPDQEGRIHLEDALRGQITPGAIGSLCLILFALPSPSSDMRFTVGSGGSAVHVPVLLVLGAMGMMFMAARAASGRTGPILPVRRRQETPDSAVSLTKSYAPRILNPAAESAPAPAVEPITPQFVERRAPGLKFTLLAITFAGLVWLAALAAAAACGEGAAVWRIAAGVAAIALGLAIVIAGLRTQRAGTPLTLLTGGLLLAALDPSSQTAQFSPPGSLWDEAHIMAQLQDQEIRGGIGDLTLDLSHATPPPDNTVPTLTINGGIGDVLVKYPSNLRIQVVQHRWIGDTLGVPSDGRLGGAGPVQLRIRLRAGIGNATFHEVGP